MFLLKTGGMNAKEKERFKDAVYEIVAAVPKGKVTSYGEIARLAGYAGYHRMVGRILHGVPCGMKLPCHRVVNGEGRLVPGWAEQREMLIGEGITFKPNGCADIGKHDWNPMETEFDGV